MKFVEHCLLFLFRSSKKRLEREVNKINPSISFSFFNFEKVSSQSTTTRRKHVWFAQTFCLHR